MSRQTRIRQLYLLPVAFRSRSICLMMRHSMNQPIYFSTQAIQPRI